LKEADVAAEIAARLPGLDQGMAMIDPAQRRANEAAEALVDEGIDEQCDDHS
jgi:hypothetical protein